MDADTKKWWMESLDLLEAYPLNGLPDDIDLRWVWMKQIGIPTEIVIKDTQVVTPVQARYWEIERWLYKGEVVEYELLRALEGFKGTAHHTSLYIVELWSGRGDDGHIEPYIEGSGLTADITKAIKYLRGEEYNVS
jgi:hypothetical protein